MFAHTIKNCQKRHATSMPIMRQEASPGIYVEPVPIEPDGLEILNKLRELSHYAEPDPPMPWERHDAAEPTESRTIDQLRLKRTLTADIALKKKSPTFDESNQPMPISQRQETPIIFQIPESDIQTSTMLVPGPPETPPETPPEKPVTIPKPIIINKSNPLHVIPAKRGPGRPRKLVE